MTITVDGRRPGPAFQGVGAIAGGGGNARYLLDYPPTQRRAILDELFSPGRGAALQLLKVEIGGDANTSDGSVPSLEQTPGHLACGAGEELWLARQALRRNPHLVVYGLQWAAPAFVRGHGDTLWTRRDINYLLHWLGCARRAGVKVRYLGGWNEHQPVDLPVVERWFVLLRRALDVHGYRSVTLVAGDVYTTRYRSAWGIAADLARDPAFRRAVGVIGIHDDCGAESEGFSCPGSPVALALAVHRHVLLWQSELGHLPNTIGPLREDGPAALARVLNAGYLGARFTATILWPLVDAMPPGLPYSRRGLITADQPWSGSFQVSPLLWVVAHTTQFTAPGWRFVDKANGHLPGGGTFVTYEQPDRRAWSMVVQTSTMTAPVRLRIHVVGGLPTAIHLWLTGLTGGPRLADLGRVEAQGGWLSVRLAPGDLYTLTTLPPRRDPPPPAVPRPDPFRLPYRPAPDAVGMARMLAPMEGSFRYLAGTLTQTTVGPPVPWSPCPGAKPYAVVGSAGWHDDVVHATVRLPPATPRHRDPGALVLTGFTGYRSPCRPEADELRVTLRGTWRLVRAGPAPEVLASGAVAPARRYRLRLAAAGRVLSAWIDGRRLATVRLAAPVSGLAGIGALGYYRVGYLRLSVTRSGRAPRGSGHRG